MILTKNFLIGSGYDQSVESDILLLDISNNNEYIWTNSFDPSMPRSKSKNIPIIVGAVLGSLFGVLLLLLGGFFLYRRIRKKQDQKDHVMQIPGSDNYYNHGGGTLQPPRNEYTNEQRIVSGISASPGPTVSVYNNGYATNYEQKPIPTVTVVPASEASTIPIYNHGQEITSYEQTTAQSSNYNLGQEAITYNYGQETIPISTSNNERISVVDINNLKNELRQEIIQSLRQEMLQNNVDRNSREVVD